MPQKKKIVKTPVKPKEQEEVVSQFLENTESSSLLSVLLFDPIFKSLLLSFNGTEKQVWAMRRFCLPSSLLHYCEAESTRVAKMNCHRVFKLSDFETAFDSDSSFLSAKEAYFCFKNWGLAAQAFNIPTGLQPLLKMDEKEASTPVERINIQQVSPQLAVEGVVRCLACLENYLKTRLNKMKLPPRIVRVANNLSMSDVEKEALTFLQVVHCGSFAPSVISHPLTPGSVARMSGMSPGELMNFMAETRSHITQGLVSLSCHTLKFSLCDTRLTMPHEAVAAFAGVNLSEEQLIKLEKTALATVLNDEKGKSLGGTKPVEHTHSAPSPLPTTSHEPIKIDDLQAIIRQAMEEGGDLLRDDESTDLGTAENTPILRGKKRSRDFQTPPNDQESPIFLHKLKEGDSFTLAAPPSPLNQAKKLSYAEKLHLPYLNDIEYCEDCFKVLATLIKMRMAEGDMKDDSDEAYYTVPKTQLEQTVRELKGRERLARAMLASRMEATKKGGTWLPKIEQVASRLNLCEFEKQILLLLVGNVVSHDILIAINGRYVMRDGQRDLTVGYVLFVLCDNLCSRVNSRQHFSRNAALVANGVLSVTSPSRERSCFNTDLMDYIVDIDRKMVDTLMGFDSSTADLVQGSRLYMPTVPLENVILPPETTATVLSTINHFDLFAKCKKKCGFAENMGTQATGLVMLFFGPSGTGKTMLANAVANKLGKKVLLVSLVQYKQDPRGSEVLRFIFREAKLNDAIIFFDECESFFESRESNPLVTAVLSEFERYDGTIILATNRAQVIDEAMNRRISLMIEFKLPDYSLREKIWRAHLPVHLSLAEDADLQTIALDFELTGGLIRNAMLAAISHAIARENVETPILRMEDFVHGAKLQLRGFFQASEKPAVAEQYVTPKRQLQDIVVDETTRKQLEAVAKMVKSRNTLVSQWGFEETHVQDQSSLCLFVGPSGTGKSIASEAIAYECGANIRLCNVDELLMARDLQIHTIFSEAKKLGAIVVFDAAEKLLNYDAHSTNLAELVQYYSKTYPRPVIFNATTAAGSRSLDIQSSKLHFNVEIHFSLPNRALRKKLWRKSIPDKMPVIVKPSRDPDAIDFDALAAVPYSAKFIQNVCFGACCKVALLPLDKQVLTMSKLEAEKEEQLAKELKRNPHSGMFA